MFELVSIAIILIGIYAVRWWTHTRHVRRLIYPKDEITLKYLGDNIVYVTYNYNGRRSDGFLQKYCLMPLKTNAHLIDDLKHILVTKTNRTSYIVEKDDIWVESYNNNPEAYFIYVSDQATGMYKSGREFVRKKNWTESILEYDMSKKEQVAKELHKKQLEHTSRELSISELQKVREYNSKYSSCISAGTRHSVGLKSDGTVVTAASDLEPMRNTGNWRDIVAVSAGYSHTVGLKANGTVIAVGINEDGCCNTSHWHDIVAISAGFRYTAGLKADGTAFVTGNRYSEIYNANGFCDIIAISTGVKKLVALRADGTVISCMDNTMASNDMYSTDVWCNIVAISAGSYHLIGLRADGTVAACGDNTFSQCDTDELRGIVAVSAGNSFSAALKADGTVIVLGRLEMSGKTDDWHDIIAISAGGGHIIGLKKDGTVIAAGDFYAYRGWSNIGSYSEVYRGLK